MFTSPHECGLCIHHIRSSTDPGLLYLAEWLCPPFTLPKHFLLDMPMLVYGMAIYFSHPSNGSTNYNV